MPNDTADGAACPTCQGNEKMRRQIDQEADELARERFRTWVAMYIAYPAVILSLLLVIGAGTVLYLKKGTEQTDYAKTEPVWCGSPVGSVTSYLPPSASQGGYEPAVPSASAPSFAPPSLDVSGFGRSIQSATAAAADRLSYYVFESIRAADGSPDARYRRDMVGLSQVEMGVARQRFADRSRRDGKLGYYRLGIAQLGQDAYEIAARRDLSVPFCRPNDFAIADKSQAFFNFAVAKACDTASATRANDWLEAIAEHESFSTERASAIEMEARNYVAGQSEVCLAQLAADGATTTSPGYSSGTDAEDTEPLPMPPAPTPGAASAERRQDGGPSDEQLFAAYARQLLNLGDAALAEGRLRRARRYWLQSIEVGKAVGAQASIMAQKRLQTHTLTCHFTDDSLKAISRDYKARSGDLVHIKVIQQALHALGHYDGPITGNVGPITRNSIRKFQREMEFDETDTLTPIQTVYLVCNAAETARDLPSQNALGIMYATGLGVEQNIDLALEWLRAASTRRFSDATFNLAILYGTGIVLKSYRLCDIPRSLEQADQYLREAVQQGHPIAADLMRRHAGKSPRERWKAIEEDLTKADTTEVYASRLAPIGSSCKPDRSDR